MSSIKIKHCDTIGQKSVIQTRFGPNNLAVYTDIATKKRPKDHILRGCVVTTFLCGTGKISITALQ